MRFCASNVGRGSKVNYDQLLALVDKLDQSSLAYIRYEHDGSKVELSKEVPHSQPVSMPTETSSVSSPAIRETTPTVPSVVSDDKLHNETSNDVSESVGVEVLSPMVGVAYLQPAPDKDPYVQVGDRVEAGDVVIMIEAMKIMTEIKAECSGIVVDILVANEELVEYDQPLIRIKEDN